MNTNNITLTIENLMSEIMTKIGQAATKQNLAELEILTKQASELKQMQEQIASIQQRLTSFGDKVERKLPSTGQSTFGQRELLIEVTQGMINQNLLTVTEPLQRGQIRVGEDMIIEPLPDGEKFKTVVMSSGNKLQERGCIGRFYRQAGVRAGDYVILREISRGQWQLSKR